MLKRISHIAISILLLVATTGLTISHHYCGELMRAMANQSAASSCCDKDSECCDHEANTLRLDSEFESSKGNSDFCQLAILTSRPLVIIEEELSTNANLISHFKGPLPPNIQELLSNIQVYIL